MGLRSIGVRPPRDANWQLIGGGSYAVLAQNSEGPRKAGDFLRRRPTVAGMITILSTVVSVLGFRRRRRASLAKPGLDIG